MAAAARPRRAAEKTETRARVAKLGLDPELGAESSYRLPGARQRRARTMKCSLYWCQTTGKLSLDPSEANFFVVWGGASPYPSTQ
ncbi:hypothetical protein LEMLEM_LOCUS4710 [Lemmus lemmus]